MTQTPNPIFNHYELVFDRYELAREFVSAMLSCAPANADQVAIITTAVAMADLLISKLSAE
jgi:hypothetical protein